MQPAFSVQASIRLGSLACSWISRLGIQSCEPWSRGPDHTHHPSLLWVHRQAHLVIIIFIGASISQITSVNVRNNNIVKQAEYK